MQRSGNLKGGSVFGFLHPETAVSVFQNKKNKKYLYFFKTENQNRGFGFGLLILILPHCIVANENRKSVGLKKKSVRFLTFRFGFSAQNRTRSITNILCI